MTPLIDKRGNHEITYTQLGDDGKKGKEKKKNRHLDRCWR